MPNLTIRRVCTIVREFLDEIKKAQFAFDVAAVDCIDGEWEVECDIQNYPNEDAVGYLIRVDDNSGEIVYLTRQEDPEESDDDDEKKED